MTSTGSPLNIIVVATTTIINIPLPLALSQHYSSRGHRLILLSSASPQATNVMTFTYLELKKNILSLLCKSIWPSTSSQKSLNSSLEVWNSGWLWSVPTYIYHKRYQYCSLQTVIATFPSRSPTDPPTTQDCSLQHLQKCQLVVLVHVINELVIPLSVA